MKSRLPARIPVHKTRKVQLNSHIYELLFLKTDAAVPKQFLITRFQTPNLEALYPPIEPEGLEGVPASKLWGWD